MIVLLGDVHGAWEFAFELIARARGYTPGPVPVLQVGDLGWHPRRPPPPAPWPIYWVEGNHDHLPSLLWLSEPAMLASNWIYCPRGTVLELDGRQVAFFGGARSIDRAVRVAGESWWPEEEPIFEEAASFRGKVVDLLVTHSPPASVVRAMGIDHDPEERASEVVEHVWGYLGRPSVVCGHMHRRFRLGHVLVLGDLDIETLGGTVTDRIDDNRPSPAWWWEVSGAVRAAIRDTGIAGAFIYGSFATDTAHTNSDVDVFVLRGEEFEERRFWGRISETSLALDREVNALVYSARDIAMRLGDPDHPGSRFMRDVLGGPKIWLREGELLTLLAMSAGSRIGGALQPRRNKKWPAGGFSSFFEQAVQVLEHLDRDEIARRGFKAQRRLQRARLAARTEELVDTLASVVSVILDGPPSQSERHE
jgi:predicted nucleotidyltransferase